MVIVDLYPFEETLENKGSEDEVIEKIDIGGVSLIRATAKNFSNTVIVANKNLYPQLLKHLTEQQGNTSLETRKYYAEQAFANTSHYDTVIHNFLQAKKLRIEVWRKSTSNSNIYWKFRNAFQKTSRQRIIV